ncbi:MAG: FtsQ-type POTRA domain-containing protein [Clostridia bacterium]|nr:FtsQ-type POTRA domain-containing protein [Clostridia bacterium]
MKKKRATRLKIILGGLAVIVAAYLIVFQTPWFIVDTLSYNQSMNISNHEIMEYTGLDQGINYFFVDVEGIQEKLLVHPYVKSAIVGKKLPNVLTIQFEYNDEFVAIVSSGMYLTMDDQLHVLKAEESVGDIFLIEGFHVKSFNIGEQIKVKDFEVLEHSVELIHLLEKSHIEAKPILKYVDGSIELELNSAYKVKFGDGSNIERKFNNFVDIYDDLNSKQAISGVIDVSNEGLPSYRPFGE